MKKKMNTMLFLVTIFGFVARAEDYHLSAGQEDVLSTEVTYGTMTVEGDLSAYVPGGTKSALKKSIGVTNLYLTGGSLTIDSQGGGQYFGLYCKL